MPERTGNRSPLNAPRNCYRSADGHWIALSASSQSTAARTFEAIGRPELIDDGRFATAERRMENADALDAIIGEWMLARTREEILARFEALEGTVAPVYDVGDVLADPHFQARGLVATVDDPELGPIRLPNVVPRLTRTPGRIRWSGRPLGADNEQVYGALGISPAELQQLKNENVV